MSAPDTLQIQFARMRRTALPGPVLLVLAAESHLNHWSVPSAAYWVVIPLSLVFSLAFGVAAVRAFKAQGSSRG